MPEEAIMTWRNFFCMTERISTDALEKISYSQVLCVEVGKKVIN